MAPSDKPPNGGIDTADYMLVQRLQKLEEVTVQFAAHTAAEEFRFEMISNQIRDLGDKVEGGMKELREALVLLKQEHAAQQKSVESLVAESNRHQQRSKFIRKAFYGTVMAIGGGALAAFGEALWNWLRSAGK